MNKAPESLHTLIASGVIYIRAEKPLQAIPEAVQQIINKVDDLCLGYKLSGVGGGGFLYMAAKDEEAAARIRQILNENRPNDKARFVELALSNTGLETSKS